MIPAMILMLTLALGTGSIVYADGTESADPEVVLDSPQIIEAEMSLEKNRPKVTPPEEEPVSFIDVSDESLWYYRPVYWAADRDLTTGIEADLFGPMEACTRAQILTFLWRAAGEPAPDSEESVFSDVGEDDYYRDAVLWAVEQGIAQGMSHDTFQPEKICTRAQCVTFLWRYSGSPDDGIRSDFADVPADSYFAPAVFWALDSGITNGMNRKAFAPESTCNRAQVMTFLYRASAERLEKEELRKKDRPQIEWADPDIDGTTGRMVLRAEGGSGVSGTEEVRAAVWTKDDQSDLRWFVMEPVSDGGYETVIDAETFGHHFGTYQISLSGLMDSGDRIRLVHLEDAVFETEPEYYVYAENVGKGMVSVNILGADETLSSLSVEVRGEERDEENPIVSVAEKTEDGIWRAVADVISFMEQGYCYLDVRSSDEEHTDVLNSIRVPVEKIKRVIDVSHHQGNIDWQTVKQTGMFEGAIIRCGYRGSRGGCGRDSRFQANASACQKLGIPMGVYWFTSALTVSEALQEADYCAKLIAPYHLSLPVFLDTEWGARKGLNTLDPAIRTQCLLAFLNRMEEYGYETGIYASTDWIHYYLDYEELSSWFYWAPSWKGRPAADDYQAWQYTSTAMVPGIRENTTDVSYWFGW